MTAGNAIGKDGCSEVERGEAECGTDGCIVADGGDNVCGTCSDGASCGEPTRSRRVAVGECSSQSCLKLHHGILLVLGECVQPPG